MKRSFTLIVALLLIHLACIAQVEKKLVGTWEGVLNAGTDLRVVFHIKETPKGTLFAEADSPDQSAYGLKCDTTFANGESLTIEMRDLQASFTGKLTTDSTIEGTFTQGGGELPLILKRQKEKVTTSTYYSGTEITIPTKNVTLSGTLFQPMGNKKTPVVLIIAGSGPTDRDGNTPALPGKNNCLLQLADSLARYGIASLRYDKRVIGKSKMAKGLGEQNATIHDMANDAKAMYEWLKQEGYNEIYIAGHSEGSLIGMLIASTLNPKGYISIAGAGRKAGDVLKEQTTGQLPPEIKAQLDNAIDSLERGLTVVKVDPSLMILLRPSLQPYMKSWLSLDPAKLISQLQCRILILQGNKDLQIKETDAVALFTADKKRGKTIAVIKNMNHVLKIVASDDPNDNVKAYSDPSLLIPGELVHAIVNFINKPSEQ